MQSVYVSQEYLAQVSRIRHHLQCYRSNFLSLAYIDGIGHEADSAYDIWINLCLITSKVRPAFLVQWIDYLDPEIYIKIIKLLKDYSNTLDPRDLDYRLLFLTDPQGIIITTYYTYYKNNLHNIYANYLQSDHDDTLLGNILGYPAAGENSLQSGDKEYFAQNQQPPNRHTYGIYITTYGAGSKMIMINIYRSSEARTRLNNLFLQITETIKLYDPDSIITVEDSQSVIDPRISQGQIHRYKSRSSINISECQRNTYNKFINSSERIQENWNTEFDRIFELGYLYNK
jgi:hypothetical protein